MSVQVYLCDAGHPQSNELYKIVKAGLFELSLENIPLSFVSEDQKCNNDPNGLYITLDDMSIRAKSNYDKRESSFILGMSDLFRIPILKTLAFHLCTRVYDNYPKEGVQFIDMSPLFTSTPQRMQTITSLLVQCIGFNHLSEQVRTPITFAMIESRGYWSMAAAIHQNMQTGTFKQSRTMSMFLRKKGLYDSRGYSVGTSQYETEYSTVMSGLHLVVPEYIVSWLESKCTLPEPEPIVLFDDLIATGGSMVTAIKIIRFLGLSICRIVALSSITVLKEKALSRLYDAMTEPIESFQHELQLSDALLELTLQNKEELSLARESARALTLSISPDKLVSTVF
jgi:adenine/guanine phosphoribosyltransferase-like PRPP-binding protein